MHLSDIASHRMSNQYLSRPFFTTPAELVAHFGAVQAQDFAAAKWALAMRLAPPTSGEGQADFHRTISDSTIEQAFNDGLILRTHILRPTWHFVAPQDIRWIQALTAPRVHAILASADRRELDIDAGLLHRSYDQFTTALRDGRFLTKEQLGEVLAQAGIEASGRRLGHIIMHAELEGLICSGPRRGKQFTYALLEERSPHASVWKREEALAELARRYFTSHGPATIADFSWWSGLTIADVKTALAAPGTQIISEEIEGKIYFRATESQPTPRIDTHLLPPYDEYVIAYKDHRPYLDPALTLPTQRSPEAALYSGAVAIDGQVLGLWRRTLSKTSVNLEITPFRPLLETELLAISAAAQRYGRFLGLTVELSIIQGS